MRTPTVSIVTPAFRPAGAQRWLRSKARNPSPDIEWIVVDDGSGPEFADVFRSFAAAGAQVIKLPYNRGQSAARNAGLATAMGSFVIFLDVDDTLSPAYITTLCGTLPSLDDHALPFAPTLHIWPNGESQDAPIARVLANTTWRDLPAESEAQLARLLAAPFVHHGGVLFPRQLLNALGGYDETLVTDEDGDLLLRTCLEGYHFVAAPNASYEYWHSAGARVSLDDSLIKIEAREAVCDRVAAELTARKAPHALFLALAHRLDRIAMSCWKRDRRMARRLLAKADGICPGYARPGRLPVRWARSIGGPEVALGLISAARWMRPLLRTGSQI